MVASKHVWSDSGERGRYVMKMVRESELYVERGALSLVGNVLLSMVALIRMGGQVFSCLPWIILYFLGFRPLDEE